MLPVVRDAIVRASQENGIDPSTALAIADRESSGNVNAGSGSRYSSAFGLFQLLKSERGAYGGNSTDPYEQATAWAHYIKGTQSEMQHGLGRDPTGPELYLGHYFGGARAARMVSGSIPGQTPVQAIFSPNELAANPNIVRAGTAGALSSSIMADIGRRTTKYAGAGAEPTSGSKEDDFNPAKWGTPVGSQSTAPTAPAPTGGPIQSSAPVPYTNPEPSAASPRPQITAPPVETSPAPMPPPLQPGAPVPFTSGQSIVG